MTFAFLIPFLPGLVFQLISDEYIDNSYVDFHITDRADYKCMAFYYTTDAPVWLIFALKNFPNHQTTELNIFADR